MERAEPPTPTPAAIHLGPHQHLQPVATIANSLTAAIQTVESVDTANSVITAQTGGDIPNLPRLTNIGSSDIHPQDIGPPDNGLHDIEQPGITEPCSITEQPTITEQPIIATPPQHPLPSSEELPPQPEAAPPDASKPPSPPRVPTKDRRASSLDHVFLSRYTIHRHESPADFQRLFREMVDTHQPQSRAEELTVLRIAQSFWQIRRIDSMEMAVADSTVEQARATAPAAHPAAVLASAFLTAKPTLQTLFFDRMRTYRRTHEETLDRLENRLLRQQSQRQLNALRATKREVLRATFRQPNPRVPVRDTRFEARINQNYRESLLPLAKTKIGP